MALPSSPLLASLPFLWKAIDGYGVVGSLLGVAAVVSALNAPESIITALLIWITVAWTIMVPAADEIRRRTGGNPSGRLYLGWLVLPRVLLTLAAVVVHVLRFGPGWGMTAAILTCGLAIGEQAMRSPVRSAAPQVANLPGWEVPLPSEQIAEWVFRVDVLAMMVVAAAASFGFSPIWALAAVVPAVVLFGVLAFQAVRYLSRRNRWEKQLPATLAKLGPVFAFHWHAPIGTAYQASMWLPYLDRLGVPYFVLVRTNGNFHEVAALTDAPVILRSTLEDLDPIVTPSLKAVFYANTAVRNSHMIRFPHLTHIQLNHGDSDKIASVSPTFRQYDRNFVAGQAAIDRFAKYGVVTRSDQFVIVGRPQLEHVQQATGPLPANPTVLYGPTWSGFYEDSDYSSLSAGPEIVAELLRRGCRVIFRPHPYARKHKGNAASCAAIIDLLAADQKATGREHVFGPAAETEWSVVDCFNHADAMISDVSSVVSDFLISRKPFAMAAVSSHGVDFVNEFPLAEVAYTFDVRGQETDGLDQALDGLLLGDPKVGERDAVRTRYLGDFGPQDCVEHFVSQARRFLV